MCPQSKSPGCSRAPTALTALSPEMDTSSPPMTSPDSVLAPLITSSMAVTSLPPWEEKMNQRATRYTRAQKKAVAMNLGDLKTLQKQNT